MIFGDYKIKWRHEHYDKPIPINDRDSVIGSTTCKIINVQTGQEIHGRVMCSTKNQFHKLTGRKLALARAFEKLSTGESHPDFKTLESKENRKSIWEEIMKPYLVTNEEEEG